MVAASQYLRYLSRLCGLQLTGDLEGRNWLLCFLGVSMIFSMRCRYLCVFQSICPRLIQIIPNDMRLIPSQPPAHPNPPRDLDHSHYLRGDLALSRSQLLQKFLYFLDHVIIELLLNERIRYQFPNLAQRFLILIDLVLIEFLEVAPGFLDGKVVKLHCEFFHLLEDIHHLLVIKQPALIATLFCLRHLIIHRIFRQLPDHMHFRRCGLVEVFLLTRNFIDKFMHGGSSNRQHLLLPSEVQQSEQVFIHLNLLYHSFNIIFVHIEYYNQQMESKSEQKMQYQQFHKKIKQNQEGDGNDGWIVVKKKEAQLAVSISDFSKVNRFYSHKSLQNYIRYILTQSIPNPMWLSIKRQSLVERIIYIDLQIQANVFESMMKKQELKYLPTLVNQTNTALFKHNNKILRDQLWEGLLSYETEKNIQEIASNKSIEEMKENTITEQLYLKYLKHTLTPQQLKSHLYPNKDLHLYSDYYQPDVHENVKEMKDWILIVDCEMVLSEAGFELARATIVNFQGEVLLDEFFKPSVEITNYNTEFSGITKEILDPITNTIENRLQPFLQGLLCEKTILVGHSLENDLRAMKLVHNKVIDSSVLYMRKNGTKLKLKNLADKILNRKIQNGSHDSLEDCLATLHLIRARIEHSETVKKKQYDLLREIAANNKKVAIIDYAIDYQMKEYNANHFEKIERYEGIGNIFKTTQKYLRNDVAVPNLILTRIQKHPKLDWCEYYQIFDSQFQAFHDHIPPFSLILLNCQVNPHIQILTEGQPLKPSSVIRNPCYIFAK